MTDNLPEVDESALEAELGYNPFYSSPDEIEFERWNEMSEYEFMPPAADGFC